jgi:hypothetical protein
MANIRLFGFTILTDDELEKQRLGAAPRSDDIKEKSFAPPQQDDGAVTVQTGSYYGTYVDLDGVSRNEVELISRYREMSMQPEIESATDDIVNEAIVVNEDGKILELDLEEVKISSATKKKIIEEFEYICQLLNWKDMSHEIFRRWYIDGRLFYHMVINEDSPKEGIKELRYIDPRRIRKIREILRTKDAKTGMDLISKINEYFLFNDRGIMGSYSNLGTRISIDSIVYVTSGLLDSKRAMVLSYLNKAIKPLNQLRMLEDATVIYRLARAPERRVFYIDVGNLPKPKAEQYLRDIMTKYRNKIVYDASTGDIRDDRRFLAMQEDFWLPRREGGKGTEISTLPGGQNLGEIQDVEYFQKKLYRALSVPFSRMEASASGTFMLGRSTEISRDEIKFSKFIDRLRGKFAGLFDTTLKTQLILKGICTPEEWEEIRQKMRYDFQRDNNFTELKESELLQNRLGVLALIDPYVGKYFSTEWVRRNVLRQSDEDIEEINSEMEAEAQIQQEMAAAAAPPPGAEIGPDGQPIASPEDGGAQPPMDDQQQQQQDPAAPPSGPAPLDNAYRFRAR